MIALENKWRASRYGLEATMIGAEPGTPVSRLIARTLEAVAPYARDLGCERELEGIERILRDGNGAQRQLRVYAEGGDVRAVTREIAGGHATLGRFGGRSESRSPRSPPAARKPVR